MKLKISINFDLSNYMSVVYTETDPGGWLVDLTPPPQIVNFCMNFLLI